MEAAKPHAERLCYCCGKIIAAQNWERHEALCQARARRAALRDPKHNVKEPR